MTPDDFVGSLLALEKRIRERIEYEYGGVPTYFDITVLMLVGRLREIGPPELWADALHIGDKWDDRDATSAMTYLKGFVRRRSFGRFVAYSERTRNESHSDVDASVLMLSGGVNASPTWRDLPVFKTAFDLALYPMILWELQPRTVIELGSARGGSAIWLADQAAAMGLDTRIVSVDLRPPAVEHPRVTFLTGDCNHIERGLPEDTLARYDHPWLIIEDAHVNVSGVLEYLDRFTRPGDYIVIEDSAEKQSAVSRFLQSSIRAYDVDTHYTDFFGRNVTSAINTILRTTGDG